MMAKALKFAVDVTQAYEKFDLARAYKLIQDFA